MHVMYMDFESFLFHINTSKLNPTKKLYWSYEFIIELCKCTYGFTINLVSDKKRFPRTCKTKLENISKFIDKKYNS